MSNKDRIALLNRNAKQARRTSRMRQDRRVRRGKVPTEKEKAQSALKELAAARQSRAKMAGARVKKLMERVSAFIKTQEEEA